MARRQTILRPALLVLAGLIIGSITAGAQPTDEQSCAGTMTEQLRRFSEKCIADLVSHVSANSNLSARIMAENEKYYVELKRRDGELVAESVSKFNYPLMRDGVAESLKQSGWAPPENESDNWKKALSRAGIDNGRAAEDITKALAAYGLKKGEAIAVTVGPHS